MKRWLCWILLVLVLAGCRGQTPTPNPSRPAPAREFRGVWIPYTQLDALLEGQTPDQAAKALDGLMKQCADGGLNAVILHVRAHADAYYRSRVYPPAKAAAALIEAGFDPLACAVDAAHRRGLTLHAWINPYRVGKTDPGLKDTFAFEKGVWYAPHSPAVQERIVEGAGEIVEGYAVDGVQFDDYFYPVGSVPDDQPAAFEKDAYIAYCREKGDVAVAVGDWRREGVSALIRRVYAVTHRRAGCVFGVSPSHDSEKNREAMYADIAEWMTQSGTVDYVCPQIYFGFDHETCPFHRLAGEWLAMPRREEVSLYIGLALYKARKEDPYAGSGKTEWQTHADVIARSIRWLRTREGIGGFCLFSGEDLTRAKEEIHSAKNLLR